MKAYQIHIEFIDSNPSIWRRVIMPADATYNRLHDVIQNVLIFKSGNPYDAYHLFAFDLAKDNMKVTNDEEAYQEHKHFMKNRQFFMDNFEKMPPKFKKFEENRLKLLETVIRKPTSLKIDKYLEAHEQILYIYDYGDDWRILVTLEQIVEDYLYGYPTLLDGKETAPPEDVGGLHGFENFLEIYKDPKHPEHEEIREWAAGQNFREFDKEHINRMLKFLKYKKTEWDKINS